MSDHIPNPGQHRTILYGHYAGRTMGPLTRVAAGPEGDRPAPSRLAS